MKNSNGTLVLVVDDNPMNRDLIARQLTKRGHIIQMAENGNQALEMAHSQAFDLVLLDVMMPDINGSEVLERLKANPQLAHIPVIMISALNDLETTVRCIELGAEDYLLKPFNSVMLHARVNASLEKKRLHDMEQAYLAQLQAEQEKSERLLLNILPKSIADQLKQGHKTIAQSFAEVTVMFADIANFTCYAKTVSPNQLVALLNDIFSIFDQLAERHRLEKIKTIGDAYMAVGGLPTPHTNHTEAVAEMALDMQTAIKQYRAPTGESFQLRIGLNTGSVVAGVIGMKKFSFDLWGDTVNIASRMEAQGLAGHIQVTPATYERLRDKYILKKRGMIKVKGRGQMTTYFLLGKK